MCWARIINFMHHRSWHKIISAAMNKKEGHLRFLNLPDGLILSKAVAWQSARIPCWPPESAARRQLVAQLCLVGEYILCSRKAAVLNDPLHLGEESASPEAFITVAAPMEIPCMTISQSWP